MVFAWFWGLWQPPWRLREPSWELMGNCLRPSGRPLGASWVLLGGSGGLLGPLWAALGPLLRSPGAAPGLVGAVLKPLGPLLRTLEPPRPTYSKYMFSKFWPPGASCGSFGANFGPEYRRPHFFEFWFSLATPGPPLGRRELRKPCILRGFRVVPDFRGHENPRKIRGLAGPDPQQPRFGYDFV